MVSKLIDAASLIASIIIGLFGSMLCIIIYGTALKHILNELISVGVQPVLFLTFGVIGFISLLALIKNWETLADWILVRSYGLLRYVLRSALLAPEH